MHGRSANPPEEEDWEDWISRILALFFLSDWRHKLAKCRRCGVYFLLKHWNRTYKRGIACSVCARTRSAMTSTANARAEALAELYRLAAQRFGRRIAKRPGWSRDAQFKAEIVDYLNARGGSARLKSVYPGGITPKWVAWAKNRRGIEKAMKGTIHAKG
jgi:hypothetical protein